MTPRSSAQQNDRSIALSPSAGGATPKTSARSDRNRTVSPTSSVTGEGEGLGVAKTKSASKLTKKWSQQAYAVEEDDDEDEDHKMGESGF